MPSTPPVSTPAAVGRRAASVAFGLWHTVQAPISPVRLLPCTLSVSWHTLHFAMSTTLRRATTLPVTAASLNTVFTASRSVKTPGVLTSPAGCPSIVTRNVPASAGSASGDVTVKVPAAAPGAAAAVSALTLIGWPNAWPLPSLAKSTVVQPIFRASALAPPAAVNAGSALMSYGASLRVGSVTENVTTGLPPAATAVTPTMLNLKRAAAAFIRAGKSCAMTMSFASANRPVPWHSMHALSSAITPPEWARVWYGRMGSGAAPKYTSS